MKALAAQSCLTLSDPWTVACQALLSMGFSRQEYWSVLPLPTPGESSQPRNWTWVSCIAGRFSTVWTTRYGSEPLIWRWKQKTKVLPLRIAITTIDLIILDLIVQQRDVWQKCIHKHYSLQYCFKVTEENGAKLHWVKSWSSDKSVLPQEELFSII